MPTDPNKHLTHLDESGNIHMVDVTAPSYAPGEKSLHRLLSWLYPAHVDWETRGDSEIDSKRTLADFSYPFLRRYRVRFLRSPL